MVIDSRTDHALEIIFFSHLKTKGKGQTQRPNVHITSYTAIFTPLIFFQHEDIVQIINIVQITLIAEQNFWSDPH